MHKQIDAMVKILKSELKENPKTSTTLGLMTQLKMAIDESNPDSIAALERSMMRQHDDKHQKTILQIFRQTAKKITIENAKQQADWNKKITEFTVKVKAACIEDAPLNELTQLLLEVDDLKAKQTKSRRSINGSQKNAREKFTSAVKLLEQWTEYKRYATSGYEDKASNVIRSLKKNSPNYPILEKAFLDKKYTETERARSTAQMEKIPKKKDSNIETEQYKIIATLEKGKLDSKSILHAIEQLEAISADEKNDKEIITQNKVNGSIRDLGDCLYYAEKGDLTNSQVLLTDFIQGTVKDKKLKPLREKATIQLLPLLYPTLGAQPLAPDQSLTRYLFELVSAPESPDEVALHNSYMHFYKEFYDYKYRPTWVKAAASQFQSLARATSAMNCQDYATALRHLRSALSHTADSGTVNAEKLIRAQIETIRKRQPSLFDPILSDNLEKMEALEQRINYYKTKLNKASIKK